MSAAEGADLSLGELAEQIRIAVPIAGTTATDGECSKRRALVDAALRSRGIESGHRAWRTAQLVDGRVVGVFANSREEAELQLVIWWGSRCHWVGDDPECRVLMSIAESGGRSRRSSASRSAGRGHPAIVSRRRHPSSTICSSLAAGPVSV
jgi:hypothetical protein